MNTLIALVITMIINGNVYQDVPHTFYSMEDCQSFIIEQDFNEDVFSCEVVEDEQ